MQQVYVKFNTAEQIRTFVNVISNIDADIDLGCGRRTVDAKSILGVFSLDFSEPLPLRFNSCSSEIKEKISPFVYHK